MNYDEILGKFKVKHRNQYQSQCICPAHNDKQASLSVKYDSGNERTVLYCQAGCSANDVLESVGLKLEDLKGKTDKGQVVRNNPGIEKVYRYCDEKGNLLFEKVRFKGKKFSQRRYINNYTIWGLEKGEYTETFNGSKEFSMKDRPGRIKKNFPLQEPIIYNLPEVINAVKNGWWVFIAEGEKDCETLKEMGFVATTASNGAGKGKWLERYSQYFKSATVIILPDNDKTGIEYAQEIKRSLKKYVYSVRVVMTSSKEKGDVTDWVKEGNTKEDLLYLIKETKEEFSPWYQKNEKTGNVKFVQGLLVESLKNAMDYIVTSSIGSKGLIHIYKDGVYKLASQNWINAEVSAYIKPQFWNSGLIDSISKQLSYKEPIDYNSIYGEENIINLRNGLYDIRTGSLSPHSKDYISCYQLNCEYKEQPYNEGIWDKFINDLSNGREEIKMVLQEYAGLTLSNIPGSFAKKVLLLFGKGDTGKSKYIEALCQIAGEENYINLKMQQLSDKFALASIYGKRIVLNGELPRSTLEDPSTLKEITGGDSLSAEFKGRDRFTFHFKGVLMFACNNLPYVKGDTGVHLFERFLIVPCNNVIPREKRDPDIVNKFMKEKDYIFKWALQGLERFVKQGYKFSESTIIENQRMEFMLESDSVRAFVNDGYIITGKPTDRIKATELYQDYEKYCEENENKPCGNIEFGKRLKNNHDLDKYKYNGNKCYRGIRRIDFVVDSEGVTFDMLPGG